MYPPARRLGLAAAALLAALLSVPLAAAELTLSFPQEIPGAGDIAGWERIEGRAELGARSIDYVLYVDPRFPALYKITRYRITVVTRTPEGRELRRSEDETLVWNSRPGVREPLNCYTLQPPQREGRWQRVPPSSDEYRVAMATAISVYAHQRRRIHAALP
jgi:hypothetical protein